MAGAAAINSGVTAVTFFSIREFVISPLLVYTLSWPQYARRKLELGIEYSSDNALLPAGHASWWDLRTHKALDTGVSGVLAGGLLRGWKSGRRVILPGALTAGAVCTVLQLAYNELSVLRLKYVSRHKKDSFSIDRHLPPPPPVAFVPQKPILERILITFGMQPISDQEYLTKLKHTRDIHLKRIKELEQQAEAEQKRA